MRFLKSLFKFLIIILVVIILAAGLSFYYLRANFYDIPVLMYHNISPPDEGNMANVTPEVFKEQMAFIADNGYKVIGPDEYLDYLAGKKPIKKNLVMITFDDGYENNYTYAFTVLKEHGFKAVIFAVVDKIDREGYLSVPQIREMQAAGIVFGSHTLNESYLPALSEEEIKKEVGVSKVKLTQLTGESVDYFAYCTGGFTKRAQEIIQNEGYLIAFTTNRGLDKDWLNDDCYAIRRIKVTNRDNWFKLWAKLTGIYNLFRDVEDPY